MAKILLELLIQSGHRAPASSFRELMMYCTVIDLAAQLPAVVPAVAQPAPGAIDMYHKKTK